MYYSTCGNVICKECLTECKNKCPYCQATNIPSSAILPCPRPLLKMLDALLIQCATCSKEMTRDRYTSHDFNQCIQPCTNKCGDQMTRAVRVAHLQNDCPLQIISCSAANVSCPWKGLRNESNVHIGTCPYVSLSSVLASLQIRLSNSEKRTIEFESRAIKAEEIIKKMKTNYEKKTDEVIEFESRAIKAEEIIKKMKTNYEKKTDTVPDDWRKNIQVDVNNFSSSFFFCTLY